MTVFPEWVQSQKLVTDLAERLGGALDETSAQLRGLRAILQSKARLCLKPASPA